MLCLVHVQYHGDDRQSTASTGTFFEISLSLSLCAISNSTEISILPWIVVKMIHEGNIELTDLENGAHAITMREDNDRSSCQKDVDSLGKEDPLDSNHFDLDGDDGESIQLLKDRYGVEIRSLCASYAFAQKEISMLNMELAKSRQEMEEQSIEAKKDIERLRIQNEKYVEALKKEAMKMHLQYEKHMIDPRMKAMLHKYTRLSDPSKGVTFARYVCTGPGKQSLFNLEKCRKGTSVLNELRLQGRTKLIYGKYQVLLVKHKALYREVNHLKNLLRKKYQKEYESITDRFEWYANKMQELIHEMERLEEEKEDLSQRLSQEIQQGKEKVKMIEDLKISERLISNKYKNVHQELHQRNSKDAEIKMFLQSCLYTMKKSKACGRDSTSLPSTENEVQALLKKVQDTQGGLDTTNMSLSDVHEFISLLVQRMNSL